MSHIATRNRPFAITKAAPAAMALWPSQELENRPLLLLWRCPVSFANTKDISHIATRNGSFAIIEAGPVAVSLWPLQEQ